MVINVCAEISAARADRIALQSPLIAKDSIKTLPGSSWNRDERCWTLPLSWTSCVGLRSVFGDGLTIGPGLLEWATRERELRIDPAMAWRDELDAPGDDDLLPHQRADVVFLSTVRRAVLASEPGVGKTAAAIRTVAKLLRDGEDVFPMLVVAPNTVKHTWSNEIDRWWPADMEDQRPRVAIISGSADRRRKLLEPGSADIYIIHWDALRLHSRLAPYGSMALKRCKACGGIADVEERQCQVHERELNRIDFRTVVADEAHRAKNPKALQTLALNAATGLAPIRFALTGTPVANSPLDLWSILHWVDPMEWPTRIKWQDRMIDFTFNIFGGIEVRGLKPEAEDEFRRTVDPRMRRMLKSVVAPFLPPVVYERREVEMLPKQRKAYEQMRDHLVAMLDDGRMMIAANPMVQVGRLTQLASSYGDITIDPTTGEPKVKLVDPSNKLDAFMADLDDFGGQPMIVFAQSRQLIDMLSERMSKKHLLHGVITGDVDAAGRASVIENFQNGTLDYVLLTIAAGGEGITLTRASVAVFLQRDWSPIRMEQALARNYRIGSEQHSSILRVDYVTPESVEDAQMGALRSKSNMLEQVVRDKEQLRSLLKGAL
jgi:SNF2 family DNA or RNA helicase